MSQKTKISAIDTSFFSGMYHGILSLILGLALLFDPNKSEPKLIYLMGLFWFTSGLALLKHDPMEKFSKRLSTLLSMVAIVTGLLVIARYYANTVFKIHIVSDGFAVLVLGIVILLTGISHFYAEIKLGGSARRRFVHYLLAILEILLGIQLVLLPWLYHSTIRQTITAWALIGSVMFIGTAVYDHRQKKKAQN